MEERKPCPCGSDDHPAHVLVEQDEERKALLAAALVFHQALDRAAESGLLDALADDIGCDGIDAVDGAVDGLLSGVPELIGRLRDEMLVNEHGAEFWLVREYHHHDELLIEIFGPLNCEDESPSPSGVPAEGFAKYFHRKVASHG